MKFIGIHTKDRNHRLNIINDGKISCNYNEIQLIFKEISSFFLKNKISQNNCICLKCNNSVSSAVMIMFCLEKDYNFFLMPKKIRIKNQVAPSQKIPNFCKYIIIIDSDNLENNSDLFDLEKYLTISTNKSWNENYEIINNEPMFYLRTSGSTGISKITEHKHSNLLGNINNCINRLKLSSNDRIAITVPIYHSFGFTTAFAPCAALCASIDLQNNSNFLTYIKREKEFNPEISFMTPVFCDSLQKVRKTSRPYRLTIVAGDCIKEETFKNYELLFGKIVQLYGSTETGAIACSSPDDSYDFRIKSVGRAMNEVKIKIKSKNKSQDSDVGKIQVNHKYAFNRYIDDYGKSFVTENKKWLQTNDIGKFFNDEFLSIYGRSDHSVNRDGHVVFFGEIEKKILLINGIETVVVISVGDSNRGKNLTACCVLNNKAKLNINEIKKLCFNNMPAYMVPDKIILFESLPLLPSGKFDRQELKKLVQNL